jgi:hypothetical protein
MKWTLATVAVILLGAAASAFYIRSTDPRPAGMAMRDLMSAAVDRASMQASLALSEGRSPAEPYRLLAMDLAEAELAYGSDPDLLDYAGRVASRPALQAGSPADAESVAALHAALMAQLELGLSHVGTPDDRFVRVMQPLEAASAELGRLGDPTSPASAFRSSDAATLYAASGAAALDRWSENTGHSH